MHLIITDAWMAKARPIHLTGTRLLLVGMAASVVLMLTSVGLYHWVFLTGARNNWPVVSQLVRLVTKDEAEQRDKFVRENIGAMATRVGEMQGRMAQFESLLERVGGLAGLPLPEAKPAASAPQGNGSGSGGGGGKGGVQLAQPRDLDELAKTLDQIEQLTGQRTDLLTIAESRLFESRMKRYLLPTQQPVPAGTLGSGFGWRADPITGRSALHTGLDFQAEPGSPILAAAGGIVVAQEWHAAYGRMVEIDHGNNLVTRYAHASKVHVNQGDVVKRGQRIADVGSTGRSTGPHLHFEVLVQGVPQDPSKFLAAGPSLNEPTAQLGTVDANKNANNSRQQRQPVQLRPQNPVQLRPF